MKTGHADKARELFNEGYNCSQAVLGAFAEDAGLDVKTALRLSAPFGGGMGRMREVCGGVSGMFMVLGLFYGYDEPDDAQAKKELYSYVRALAEKFKESEGSIICRELLAGEHIALGVSRRPENGAEAAAAGADIGIIDVAVDDIIGYVAVAQGARPVGQCRDLVDIGMGKQGQAVFRAQSLASEHFFADGRHAACGV